MMDDTRYPDPPEDAEWLAAYRERAKLVGTPPKRRTIANVREASVVARATLLVLGIVLALLAVVGTAYLWSD